MELDEPPVVDDAVDHGGCHLVVPEHRSPPTELQVRGDRHRLSLVGVGEGLEEKLRPVRIDREEPELVDDEQAGAPDEGGLPVELPASCAPLGTVRISVANPSPSSFPGGLAKVTVRENYTARAAPPRSPERGPLAQTVQLFVLAAPSSW